MPKQKSPFTKSYFANVRKSLQALDAASKKNAHDSKYTADGVLLEAGLKVWCVDLPIGGEPWTVDNKNTTEETWRVVHDEGRKGKRDVRYTVMYACKLNAISTRIGVVDAQIMEITKDKITPKKEEINRLGQMAIEDLTDE